MNYIYYNYIQKCPPTKTKLQQIHPTDKSDILKNKNLKPVICFWFIIIYDSTHDSIPAFPILYFKREHNISDELKMLSII